MGSTCCCVVRESLAYASGFSRCCTSQGTQDHGGSALPGWVRVLALTAILVHCVEEGDDESFVVNLSEGATRKGRGKRRYFRFLVVTCLWVVWSVKVQSRHPGRRLFHSYFVASSTVPCVSACSILSVMLSRFGSHSSLALLSSFIWLVFPVSSRPKGGPKNVKIFSRRAA